MIRRKYKHAHWFSGLGGFAKGINQSVERLGEMQGEWECLGGIDCDEKACKDFESLAGVPATCADLFDHDQYVRYHGHEPPKEWREQTVDDVRRAFRYQSPDAVFISAPCKGFSGLTSEAKSLTARYQALNELALRALLLSLEAFKDQPAKFYCFENVPRISVRGRDLLDQIIGLLEGYGYAARETRHDCGEIAHGGMAQSRKRFLLIARHVEQVPPFLYEPQKHNLQPVSSVLGRMRLPGDVTSGPMHRIPNLSTKTWMRLAFVRAGSDWRSLNDLVVENGVLRDYALTPGIAVPDPKFNESAKWNTGHAYGVNHWHDHTGALTSQCDAGQGYFAVADPRPTREKPFRNVFRVVKWAEVGRAVTSGGHPTSGGVAVADPRSGLSRGAGDAYLTCGHYGVVPWQKPSGAVTARINYDNGPGSVADPRCAHEGDTGKQRVLHLGAPKGDPLAVRNDRREALHPEQARHLGALPAADERGILVVRSLDGTWHRPFTTLELAALQTLIEPEEHLELAGLSDRDWRERIGNAVPPKAGKAIGGVLSRTMMMAETGETFILSSTPIWVREIALALTLN